MKLSKFVLVLVSAFSLAASAAEHMYNNEVVKLVTIPVEHSIEHIKCGVQVAHKSLREVHLVLGAAPHQIQFVRLLEKEGNMAPLRIFIDRDAKNSSPEAPVLTADFNDVTIWNRLTTELNLIKPFCGPVDKIYFDMSSSNCARWDLKIMMEISKLVKSSGAIYIQDKDVYTDCVKAAKKYPSGEVWHNGGILHNDATLFCNPCYIFDINVDADSQFKQLGYGSFRFEAVNGSQGYPDIGIDLREGYIPIQQYVKVTPLI